MKAIITVGISGSGKSTWAKYEQINNDCISVINRDETRWDLSGKRGWNGPDAYKFNSKTEDRVTDFNYQTMMGCAALGKDIIIADTNLNPKTRNKLIKQCEDFGYEVEIKEFDISFQEACKRNKERGIFSVGEAVLMKQWEQWCKYHEEKGGGMW